MKIYNNTDTNCLKADCSVPDNGDIEFGEGNHINGNLLASTGKWDNQDRSDNHAIFAGINGSYNVNIGCDDCTIKVTGELQIGGGYTSSGADDSSIC